MVDKSVTDELIQNALRLGGLVKDWDGFEKLIAELNRTGNVTVEHDVTLVGKSGAPRQIDVLIRHQEGLIEHRVIVDCKHWKERVGRLHVDALATAVRDLNASRGVLFSVVGFESGAVTLAKTEGIDLFTVREPTDEEWGLPGRHVDIFLTYVEKSLRNLMLPNVTGSGIPANVPLNLHVGSDDTSTKTPIEPYPGFLGATFEALMETVAAQAAQRAWKPERLLDGAPGQRSFWAQAEIVLQQPVVIPRGLGKLFIPKIAFDIGLKIHQTRFQLDRSAKYAFVLAVKDCVRGIMRTAARVVGDDVTALAPMGGSERSASEPLRNGTIFSIGLNGFFDFSELVGLEKGEFRDVLD